MQRISIILGVLAVFVLMAVSAVPAMAADHGNNWNRWNNNNWNSWNNGFNHPFNNGFNDNGVSQSSDQNVESGDSSQTFNVSGGGDNSNQTAGIQGISNTGNAVNSTNVLQADPFDNGFFNSGFTPTGVGIFDSGNFGISPSQTTTSTQSVDQAAAA
jgi:hypothetical protein